MKPNVVLVISSLLSILFVSLHTADDIVRGMEPGTLSDLIIVPILVLWLYGMMALPERRWGYVIVLVGSLLGMLVPVIHMKGAGVGGDIARSNGAFFFIWTLIALAVTALLSVILSARGLWEHRSRQTGVPGNKAPLHESSADLAHLRPGVQSP